MTGRYYDTLDARVHLIPRDRLPKDPQDALQPNEASDAMTDTTKPPADDPPSQVDASPRDWADFLTNLPPGPTTVLAYSCTQKEAGDPREIAGPVTARQRLLRRFRRVGYPTTNRHTSSLRGRRDSSHSTA